MIVEEKHSLGTRILISFMSEPRRGFTYAPYMMRDAVKERGGAASLLFWLAVWQVERL